MVVDTTLAPGALSYGEVVIPETPRTPCFLSAHVCHPSLANDNLSGIVVATEVARALAASPPGVGYTYRVIFAPGTSGRSPG